MTAYPVNEPYGPCDGGVPVNAPLYLGAFPSNPITTIVGTFYWNTELNIFRMWDDGQWLDVNPVQFDGIVDGGTRTRNDTIQIRGDTAANWSIANPILLNREFGLETDTKYFKFGNGTSAWNDLAYPTIPKERVTGIENVDNTSDINKPVSTLQAAADALVLNTANTYTDDRINGLFRDVGDYASQVTGKFPVGTILKGYVYRITDSGPLGSYTVHPNDSLRALINDPGQIEANWLITPRLTNLYSEPYIISAFIPGNPLGSSLVMFHVITTAISLEANLPLSKAQLKFKPNIDVIFYIKKNNLIIGSVKFTSGSFLGEFTFVSPVSLQAGDSLEIYSPIVVPTSIADISITIHGARI